MAQHNVRRRFAIEAEQQLAKRSGLSTLRTAVTAVEAFRRAGLAGAASSSRSSSALPTPASSAPPSPEHKREPGPGGYTGGPPGGVGSGVGSPESSCGGYPGGGSNPSERPWVLHQGSRGGGELPSGLQPRHGGGAAQAGRERPHDDLAGRGPQVVREAALKAYTVGDDRVLRYHGKETHSGGCGYFSGRRHAVILVRLARATGRELVAGLCG
jgi:hypothetical protein